MANVKKREYNGVHGAYEAVELCTQKPETRWVCGGTEMRGIACEKNEKRSCKAVQRRWVGLYKHLRSLL